jgi:hypothetical protein
MDMSNRACGGTATTDRQNTSERALEDSQNLNMDKSAAAASSHFK